MSSDFIPVIYSLRSKVNELLSIEGQTEAITEAMLHLERVYSNFDELDIVKDSKNKLSEHLLGSGSELNVKNHLQAKGFEPIKRAVIHSHIETTPDKETLLDYKFKISSNKKQKSGGFSYTFDFDDLPAFESLESIILEIRNNYTDPIPFEKLLSMDLSELSDHHQWEEALQVLYTALNMELCSATALILLTLLHRFIVGFQGTSQGLDTINCTLRYIYCLWVRPKNTAYASTRQDDKVTRSLLALFITIIRACSTSLLVPYQKEVDRAVVYIFLILSKGEVYIGSKEKCVSVVEILAGCSGASGGTGSGDAVSALIGVVHPLTALSYATETGLLSRLLNITLQSSTTTTTADELTAYCLSMRILLALLSGHQPRHTALFLQTHHRDIENENTTDTTTTLNQINLSIYEWKGDWEIFDAVPMSGRAAQDDFIVPVEGTNKRFLHLNQAESIFPTWFEQFNSMNNVSPTTMGDSYLLRWIKTHVRVLEVYCSTLLNSETAASYTQLLQKCSLGEVLRLVLRSVAGHDISVSASSSSREVVDILISCVSFTKLFATVSSAELRDSVLQGLLEGLCEVLNSRSERDLCGSVKEALNTVLSTVCELGVFDTTNSHYTSSVQQSLLQTLMGAISAGLVCNGSYAILAVQFRCNRIKSRIDVISTGEALINQNNLHMKLYGCFLQQADCMRILSPDMMRTVSNLLLRTLLAPGLECIRSADMNQRSVTAVLHLLSLQLSIGDSTVKLFSLPPLIDEDMQVLVVEVLVAEYRDAFCWERAYECDQMIADSSTVFAAVFTLLTGLMRMGQFCLVGELLQRSWGAAMDCTAAVPDEVQVVVPLENLIHLNVLIISNAASVAHLQYECIYPYILRLLVAGQTHPAFIQLLQQEYSSYSTTASMQIPQQQQQQEGLRAEYDEEVGTDITSVFRQLSLCAISTHTHTNNNSSSRSSTSMTEELQQLHVSFAASF